MESYSIVIIRVRSCLLNFVKAVHLNITIQSIYVVISLELAIFTALDCGLKILNDFIGLFVLS